MKLNEPERQPNNNNSHNTAPKTTVNNTECVRKHVLENNIDCNRQLEHSWWKANFDGINSSLAPSEDTKASQCRVVAYGSLSLQCCLCCWRWCYRCCVDKYKVNWRKYMSPSILSHTRGKRKNENKTKQTISKILTDVLDAVVGVFSAEQKWLYWETKFVLIWFIMAFDIWSTQNYIILH